MSFFLTKTLPNKGNHGGYLQTFMKSTNFQWKAKSLGCSKYTIPSLKGTANAPENGWLEYDRLLPFGDGLLILGAMFMFQRRYIQFCIVL